MDEDLMKMVEQVVSRAQDDSERMAIKAYINGVVSTTINGLRCNLALCSNGIPEPARLRLEKWRSRNGAHIAIQIGEVLRLLLEKELLPGHKE